MLFYLASLRVFRGLFVLDPVHACIEVEQADEYLFLEEEAWLHFQRAFVEVALSGRQC